jgi:hypothetical protein
MNRSTPRIPMTTTRFVLITALSLPLSTSCFQPVDSASTKRNESWNGVLTDHVVEGDRDVFTDIEETMTVPTGCDKTKLDAQMILQANCAGCHAAGAASRGVPPFDFVMDVDKLINTRWMREGQPEDTWPRFLIPGDAENSLIFIRAGRKRDMPPIQMDPGQPFFDRVSYRDASVLYDWIQTCLGADPLGGAGAGAGGSTGTGGTSGTTGAGGSTGADGGVGAGGGGGGAGAGGAGAGGATADAGGGTLAACAANVANNGNCNQAAAPCALAGGQTCTCTAQGGGGRRWVCI